MVDYYSCKMSGSDEEFEPQIQTGMTKAELRRSNKPIMEKRRRARINQCLDELKSLILEAMKKDPTRHSKLEKADILEMTVKHLQQIQRQQLSTAVATDPAVLTKFRSGFSECASEVSRYVNHLENVDPTVKQRLVSHLNNCVSNLQQVSPFYNHYVPYMPERLYPEVKVGFQTDAQSGDENNNGSARIQIPSNVQLIPSRLPSGEFALLVPPSAGIGANFPFFPPGAEAGARLGQPSAFTAVQRTHSPLLSPSTSTSSFEEGHHSELYPTSLSPPQSRFKMPEHQQQQQQQVGNKGLSSPDTQRPQISSSSDRSSPSGLELKIETCPTSSKRELPESSSRQPLSVITDKYNRSLGLPRREGALKRHHSDGLLAVAEKRPRNCQEAAPSVASTSGCSSPVLRVKEEFAHSTEDLSEGATSVIAGDATTTGNGDMWRPW
ncbi:PREDICTED: transcription factor HES-1-A-like [Ceratosolen solmsi marchali]|uniref:Transcription factor HES-1-A-like n=1 Tax=Ceratosolen solmsi marchali TaxID=326594 RepID=A0AAJ6YMN3_9HYME|nr:PREDICTED: transcription factor HES-1-A-like [Ceratosolen solmsi marchali]